MTEAPVPLHRPPEWTSAAACRGMAGAGFDPWHPDEDDPAAAFQYALARQVCAGCPVRMNCLGYALDLLATTGVQGMLAGLKPPELRRLARENGYPARIVAQHGTRSRYVAGCRCQPCRRSNARGENKRRREASLVSEFIDGINAAWPVGMYVLGVIVGVLAVFGLGVLGLMVLGGATRAVTRRTGASAGARQANQSQARSGRSTGRTLS